MASRKKFLMLIKKVPLIFAAALVVAGLPGTVSADEGSSAAAEMMRKLQNPLANIKALMTDNVIGFETGNDEGTSFSFQLQGIYAVDFPDKGFTMIPRAIVPIMGLEPGTDKPWVGQPDPTATQSVWGLSDSMIQLFFAPYTKGGWKWGVGPQVSLATATKAQLEGPQWGVGAVGVLVGNFTEKLSFAGILGNHWGNSGDFNSMLLQPMLFYTVGDGKALAYNAVISADWKADSGNTWTVPLGLSWNQTIDMGGGHGFDYLIGPYWNVVRPDGAARWEIRFGINWLFP